MKNRQQRDAVSPFQSLWSNKTIQLQLKKIQQKQITHHITIIQSEKVTAANTHLLILLFPNIRYLHKTSKYFSALQRWYNHQAQMKENIFLI